jgi:hypothetical protein
MLPIKGDSEMYYNFNAKAELHRLEMKPVAPGFPKLTSPSVVLSGTLEQCIRKVMERPKHDRDGYSIQVDPDANLVKTHLGVEDIEHLHNHPEFPKR